MVVGSSAQDVVLVASGDLRETANRLGWPAQAALERQVVDAFARHGVTVRRGHPVDATRGHGFISSQRMGMDVFAGIDRDAPLVVAEAVWQYSHHVLPGLRRHRGPILTIANWDGTWPGLVGMLNINASLTKMGRAYSSIWGEDLADPFAGRRDRALDRDRAPSSTTRATSATWTSPRWPPTPRPPAAAWPASWPTGWPSSASSMKAAWACTTRSSMTSTSTRSGSSRSASASPPSSPRCAWSRPARPAPATTGCRPGHGVPPRAATARPS